MATWTVDVTHAGVLGSTYSYGFGSAPGEAWIWGEVPAGGTAITFSGISPPNRAVLILGRDSTATTVTISNGTSQVQVPVAAIVRIEVEFVTSTHMAVVVKELDAPGMISPSQDITDWT